MLWNRIKNVVRKYWMMLPNFLKFSQTRLAVSVFVVCLLLYFQCCDIRFLDLLLIIIVIPILAYAFGIYYYTCVVITVSHDENTLYKIVADGKEYRLEPGQPHIKIHFSRKGKHSVYLYDENGMVGDGPQEANTYEHHITYVEFKKKDNKNDE